MSGGQTGGLLSNLILLVLLAGAFWRLQPTLTLAFGLNVASLSLVLPFGLLALRRQIRSELVGDRETTPLPTKALLATSLPLMVIQLVSFASSQADLWIAGVVCTESLALYGAARRLMLVVVIPLQMVNFLVMASVAELHSQRRIGELEALLRRAATVSGVPSLLALFVAMSMGGTILAVLFGPYYRDAAPLLALLSLGQFALAWAGSSQCALIMTGRQNVAMGVNVAAALLLTGLGTFVGSKFGAVGLAATSAGVVVAESLTQWALARKLVGVRTNMSFDLSAIAELMGVVGAALPAVVGSRKELRETAAEGGATDGQE
jgi:O-antigen/teichoic acid export membrane protein